MADGPRTNAALVPPVRTGGTRARRHGGPAQLPGLPFSDAFAARSSAAFSFFWASP